MDPLFWLGLSILLVAVSITAVLMAALPAFQELSRAARSAEKLFDTLNRELPPTLEAIRLTSLEITELTDDMTEGVQNVGRMTQQMDEGVVGVRQQAKQANITTRSVVAGVKAAFSALARPSSRRAAPVPARPRLPSQVEEFEELEDAEEIVEALEIESAPAAPEPHATRPAQPHFDPAQSLNFAEPIAESPFSDPNPADHTEGRSHNGNSHSPQLRSASSPPLNLPAADPPQPSSLPVKARRDRQS